MLYCMLYVPEILTPTTGNTNSLSVFLGHGDAEADEGPEGESGPADDGHPLQPVLLHPLRHHRLKILGPNSMDLRYVKPDT